MQFPSRYALLVCGPLSIWGVGCSAVTHRPVTQAGSPISNTDRLLSMAQIYEQKGQLQQAHKLYCQVLQENPNHAVAREHATDLMAAISNTHSAKDPSEASQVAETRSSNAGRKVASIGQSPTDPALLGRHSRKILSDDEVAARVPKPRAIAQTAPARKSTVATVTHQQANVGKVIPAEQINVEPLQSPAMTIEEPLVIVEAPQAIELSAVEPLFVDLPEQVVTSSEPAPDRLPVITSSRQTIVVESAPTRTRVKTPTSALCPNASEHLQGSLVSLDAVDPEARKAALEELVNSGRSLVTCLPAIRACLADADPIVQAHAAWAMWSITGQSSEAIQSLTGVLECNQEQAVVFACYVLGTMGPQAQSATATLSRLQDDDSNAIRVHASEAMLKISQDGAPAVRVLAASLSSHRADERSLAAVALGSASGGQRQAAISALITALYDQDAGVRCSAALTLGGYAADATSAISALEVAASATDVETRDAANTALACIRK